MLEAGMKAPDFTLNDKNGNAVSLSDFKGKKVVLYFYPRDNTPGCTRQACAFGARYKDFEKKGIVVIGISKDSTASHEKFAQKHNLPFILLSDPDLEAIQVNITPITHGSKVQELTIFFKHLCIKMTRIPYCPLEIFQLRTLGIPVSRHIQAHSALERIFIELLV